MIVFARFAVKNAGQSFRAEALCWFHFPLPQIKACFLEKNALCCRRVFVHRFCAPLIAFSFGGRVESGLHRIVAF